MHKLEKLILEAYAEISGKEIDTDDEYEIASRKLFDMTWDEVRRQNDYSMVQDVHDEVSKDDEEDWDDEDNMYTLRESEEEYPSFEVDKNIKYQDTVITKGYWSYTGKESAGRGVYLNVMNQQMQAFNREDIEIFIKNLPSHFKMVEGRIEDKEKSIERIKNMSPKADTKSLVKLSKIRRGININEVKTLGLEELPATVRKSIEDRYGISKWPDKDFVSSTMSTYFKTISVNDTTGEVGHRPIALPSFEGLYSNFSDIVQDIKKLVGNEDIRKDKKARDLFELIKTNFRKLQTYLRSERPDQYELMRMRRSMEEAVGDLVKLKDKNGKGEEHEVESEFTDSHKQDFFTVKGKKGVFDKIDLVKEADEPTPEEEGDEEAPKDTVLEDATDTMVQKFPTLKATLIKLQTEDFKEFVDSIDWISPRPTSFRVNLANGQDYILKWTGTGFEAQIMGKRYYIDKINDYQQALDKLSILYKEGPFKSTEEPAEVDTDSGSSAGSGGDFPGEDGGATGGDDGDLPADLGGDGDDGGGADLTGEPVDFEEPTEDPEA